MREARTSTRHPGPLVLTLGSAPRMPKPADSPERAKLTVYDGLYHAGWDEAYGGSRGDDIYSWMLGFIRP